MKKVIAILSAAVLAGFTPVDKPKPTTQETAPSHTGTFSSPTCPFYAPTPATSESYDSSNVPLYIHCSKCQQGVMSDHTDGVEKCTFCGERG